MRIFTQKTAVMNKEVCYIGIIYINKNLGKEQAFSPFKHACFSYEKCSSRIETVYLNLISAPWIWNWLPNVSIMCIYLKLSIYFFIVCECHNHCMFCLQKEDLTWLEFHRCLKHAFHCPQSFRIVCMLSGTKQ